MLRRHHYSSVLASCVFLVLLSIVIIVNSGFTVSAVNYTDADRAANDRQNHPEYANSIVLRGFSPADDVDWRAAILQYTRDNNNQIILESKLGTSNYMNRLIHTNFKEVYYSITLRGSNNEMKKQVNITGKTRKVDAVAMWGKVKANEGDIISIYLAEPSKTSQYDSKGNLISIDNSYIDRLKSETQPDLRTLHYRVTSTGFERIHVEEVDDKPVIVNADMYESDSTIKSRAQQQLNALGLGYLIDVQNFSSMNLTSNSRTYTLKLELIIDNVIKRPKSIQLLVNPGSLNLSVPKLLEFQDYIIGGGRQLLGLKNNPSINILDNRGTNQHQGNWKLTLSVEGDFEIANNLIYRTNDKTQKVSDTAIISESTQSSNNKNYPEMVDITRGWSAIQGLLVDIPNDKHYLFERNTEATLFWNFQSVP